MKKVVLILLFSAGYFFAEASKNESTNIFSLQVWEEQNVKKAFKWALRVSYHLAKIYLGKQMFAHPVATPCIKRDGSWKQYWKISKAKLKFWGKHAMWRGGGIALILHGIDGALKECGFKSLGDFIRQAERHKP